MQSQSIRNPDSRPIPPGWTTHFDNQRNIWYYVNLQSKPPKVTFLHPDDEDPPSDSDFMPSRPPPQHYSSLPPEHTYTPTNQPPQQYNPSTFNSNIMPVMQLPPASNPYYGQQRHAAPTSTPFASVIQAQRAKQASAAQQLYASCVRPQIVSPASTEASEQAGISSYFPSQLSSNQANFDPSSLYASPLSSPTLSSFSSPTSSSSSMSSPMPALNSFSQRPRGARSPSIPRPSISESNYTPFSSLSPSSENTDDFRTRTLFNAHTPPPPSNIMNPPVNTVRHHRSATVPNNISTRPSSFYPTSSSVFGKQKETPMYTTTAQPLAVLGDDEYKHTTAAFQPGVAVQQPPSTTLPILHESILPLTFANVEQLGTLPPGAAMPHMALTTIPAQIPLQTPQFQGMPAGAALPQMTLANIPMVSPQESGFLSQLSPTQISPVRPQTITGTPLTEEPRADAADEKKKKRNKVLKKVGVAVGKSALKVGTKMALGSVGVPVGLFFSDDEGAEVIAAISSGIAETATSSAASAASNAIQAAASTSTSQYTVGTSSPSPMMAGIQQQSLNVLPAMQPAVFPTSGGQSYEEIVAQMNALHIQQQPQQLHPQPQLPQQTFTPSRPQQNVTSSLLHQQQSNVTSPSTVSSDYANLVNQMQLQQQQHQHQMKLAQQQIAQQQLALQQPAQMRPNGGGISHANNTQGPARPQGPGLLGSIMSGATNAVVSSAINYGLNGGLTDLGNTFADLTASFDSAEC